MARFWARASSALCRRSILLMSESSRRAAWLSALRLLLLLRSGASSRRMQLSKQRMHSRSRNAADGSLHVQHFFISSCAANTWQPCFLRGPA
jgi:hypothetical protein